ncbi:hypothetical protein B0H11DRAFT_48872 [Mycena galericulata]|nr:hypothetical protein B0H11DRAFT_48872 [Mycena galericulata]
MIELLPVELVLIILRGSAIADILNFTRTSSYFRRISLTNRSVWCDASDSYKLRLPLGETLKTTAIFDLPRNAARSASIAHKWQLHRLGEPSPIPIRTYEATRLYELPSWAFWSPLKYSKPSCLGHAPPTFINILPGGHAFLFGSMAHLGIYDLHGEYEYALEVPCSTQFDPRPGQGDSTVDWHSVDNGAHITVVVLSKAFNVRHDVESYLSVFDVDYVQGNAPSIRRTHILTLPIHATAISIKGSLILINSRDAFLIVNLKTKQRAVWHLSDMACTPPYRYPKA